MSNLSPEKRNQLILISLATVGIICGLWLGLVRKQQASLRNLAKEHAAAQHTLSDVKRTIDSSEQIETRLADASKQLATIEQGMASGDLYSWVITTVRQFKTPYKMDIPQFSQIDGPKDVTLIPSFPYKQATLTISGTAAFHEFGRFIADFENEFPHIRLMNLSLEPASSVAGTDKEKLTFKLDIVALVKPNGS
jgi:hypothetical protein